jgi:hypothetical protein
MDKGFLVSFGERLRTWLTAFEPAHFHSLSTFDYLSIFEVGAPRHHGQAQPQNDSGRPRYRIAVRDGLASSPGQAERRGGSRAGGVKAELV